MLPASSSVVAVSSPRTPLPDEEMATIAVSAGSMDGEEMVGLLEDSRGDTIEEDGRSNSGKRISSKDRMDKHDKRGRRSTATNPDGWNLRENFWWLWGGSQASGVLCVLVAAICYGVMGLSVRLLAVQDIPSFETIFIRCAVIATLSAALLKRMGHPLLGSPNLKLLLLSRAALGFVSLAAFFYSIQVLPLRDATLLNFTVPVFTVILATLLLDEKFGSRDVAGTACCLLGVLMVTQPPLIFGGRQLGAGSGGEAKEVGRQESIVAVLLALLSALGAAGAYCIVRSIGKTGEPPLVVVFVFAAFSCPLALICLLLFQTPVLPGVAEFIGMLINGAIAFVAQVLLTRGLQLERAGRATAMLYAKLVTTFLLGILFLNDSPTLKGIAGAILISVALVFMATGEKERSEERA